MAPRQGAVGIVPALSVWAEKIRAQALATNMAFSPEIEVMTELLNIVAANPFSLLVGYNMATIDALSTKDAALRCNVKWLFEASHKQMDLYKMPVIKALRDVFPVGCGRCSTTLSSVRQIIELDSPLYFCDVVGNAHDALCDAHVLRYYTPTVHAMLVTVSCK